MRYFLVKINRKSGAYFITFDSIFVYTKLAEHVELRGESIISNCHTADSVDYKMLRCEMFSDSEESTISDSSGDSDDQVD